MPLSQEIIEAAQALGTVLRQSPSVQAYLESCERFKTNPQVQQLEEQVTQRYQELVKHERSGKTLSSHDLSLYHNSMYTLRRSPLFIQRESTLQDAKFTCAQAAETLSSVLSINYINLVDDK
jgi:hypothetical protein